MIPISNQHAKLGPECKRLRMNATDASKRKRQVVLDGYQILLYAPPSTPWLQHKSPPSAWLALEAASGERVAIFVLATG